MAKIYVKNTWTDEVLAGSERYNILTNAGAAISENVQIELNTAVSIPGSPVTAARMNNIENGIDALDTLLNNSALKASQANVETISATKALVDTDAVIQRLTPSAAHRDVALPTVASTNHLFFVVNPAASSFNLVVKTGATTLKTLTPGLNGLFISDGVAWNVL